MSRDDPSAPASPYSLAALRNELLDDAIFWMAVLSLPTLAFTLAQIPQSGIRTQTLFHGAMVVLVWGLWLLRRQLPFALRLGLLLVTLGAVGLAGYAAHGLAALTAQFLLLFVFIAALFLDGRPAIRMGVFLAIGLVVIAWSAIDGRFTYDFDYTSHVRDPANWGLLIYIAVGYGSLVAYIGWRLVNRLVENQEALRTANAELEVRGLQAADANRLKTEILANLGHEFRTPMNGILGMADLMQTGEMDADCRIWLGDLQTSAQRLQGILDRLLELVRLEGGEIALRPDPFELREFAAAVVRRHAPRAEAKGLDLELQCDPGLPGAVTTDGPRLQQLLAELLDNAITFTAQGRIRLQINAAAAPPGDTRQWLGIAVSDSGPGIPADRLPTIFEPFSQVDASITRTVGGNGLGLAISNRIAKLLGGTIRLRSTPGQGTTVEVSLPV